MVRTGIIVGIIGLVGCTHYVEPTEPILKLTVHYKKPSIQDKINFYKEQHKKILKVD